MFLSEKLSSRAKKGTKAEKRKKKKKPAKEEAKSSDEVPVSAFAAFEEGAAVVVVDPISTGAMLAHEYMRRKIKVVRVWSRSFPPSLVAHTPKGLSLDYAASIQHNQGQLDRTLGLLQALPFKIGACVAGSEVGVECADMIGEGLGLRCNGTSTAKARRNKYLMGERIRECGVRAVKQARVTKWHEVEAFVQDLKPNPFLVVIKPVQSAGSDGVFLCKSKEVLQKCFNELIGELNVLGTVNSEVLVQECLVGTEYVVDTCSMDGVHKIVSIWQYDKRPANGKFNIYFGLRMLSADEDPAPALCDYIVGVLDALHISNGPGHAEVIVTKTGPCLVEVGARPHGGEGAWLPIPRTCLGYSQVSATADHNTSPARFHKLPPRPLLTHHWGFDMYMVSKKEGVFAGYDEASLEKVRGLKSFVQLKLALKAGEDLTKTIDVVVQPGSVTLVSDNKEQLEADIAACRALLEADTFLLVEEGVEPVPIGVMSPMLRNFTPRVGGKGSISMSMSYKAASSLAASYKEQPLGPPGVLSGAANSGVYDNPQASDGPMPAVVMTPHSVENLLLAGSLRATGALEAKESLPKVGGEAVVVVDPLSTGANLAASIWSGEGGRRPVHVIRVFSRHYPPALMNLVPEGLEVEFAVTVQHDGDIARTVKILNELPYKLLACIPGCEPAVECAEVMCEALGFKWNGAAMGEVRRNKYLMGEQVRRCGVRAVKQARCTYWRDVEAFLKEFEHDPYPIIVKPIASAGSDGVFKCTTLEELRTRFDEIHGALNMLGEVNSQVVCQEFLEGKEYVVDTVSYKGQHKVAAIWEYDKRMFNGQFNIYFGVRIVDVTEPGIEEMIQYQLTVLDALGFKNGPGHGEVMMTPTGPCLVEVGARCHGLEGIFLDIARPCVGYTQVSLTGDVVVDAAKFLATPDRPKLLCHGREVTYVNSRVGVVTGYREEDLAGIRALKSFAHLHILAKIGHTVSVQLDCMAPAVITLVHEDNDQILADYETARQWEHTFLILDPIDGDAPAQADELFDME
mmetsp:Transcript_16853/g.18791  ORF Transcript_16853/g.18791 Transcript_16853/m.18791 type:complete len:1024 (+) Transcript_16853:22-3093(+)|eukprot:CAMPEP_0205829610 /NCGR_PEP_ID=MMETSP0206-20130828/38674_1 /ASSEMBLY_ACC=CAM_ASM_000279 /TAXON_ID=36767 /ORGANISM="Euplotes focardii, Strain TN1" /LENGTH=1023 /DNA_ID=CAMNT_0053132481 /DNA_START=19 /DNA_END=3090 /DNA_ORIENTATION=-